MKRRRSNATLTIAVLLGVALITAATVYLQRSTYLQRPADEVAMHLLVKNDGSLAFPYTVAVAADKQLTLTSDGCMAPANTDGLDLVYKPQKMLVSSHRSASLTVWVFKKPNGSMCRDELLRLTKLGAFG